MVISSGARARLGEAMDARRVELALTWRQVASTGGISYETLRATRRGAGDIPELTRAAIERGLRWERGSVASVLAGDNPKPMGRELTQEIVDERRAELSSMSVEEFIERFRFAESVYLDAGDRAGPDRWLKNALTAREEAIREYFRAIAERDSP